jgi:methanogenic corrinoid protein MtbC1
MVCFVMLCSRLFWREYGIGISGPPAGGGVAGGSPMDETFDAYFGALSAADAWAAADVLASALDCGEAQHQLIREVIVPAQRRVGELWFSGEWNVADEHAATAVSEHSLVLLANPRPGKPSRRVVLACAEGEWHTLPARLAANLAGGGDVDIVMLGGSVPAEHLRQYLRASQPDALALSCTMPTNLIGAARSISAAHAEHIPVIVGGAAWGSGDHRATQLGADLRLEDPGALGAGLKSVSTLRTLARAPEIPHEALLLDSGADESSLRLALWRQCAENPWMNSMTRSQRQRSLEDLRWLARHAAAAVACDDPTIVRNLLSWLLNLLTPKGVPATAIVDSCRYLADSIDQNAPRAAAVLRSEADLAAEQLRAASHEH